MSAYQLCLALLWSVLGGLCLWKSATLFPDPPPKTKTYFVSYAVEGGAIGGTWVTMPEGPTNWHRIDSIRANLEGSADHRKVVILGIQEISK